MRLLVVSNRLPVTITSRNGKLDFQESMGGLVSGLSAYLDSLKGSSFTQLEYLWVGWPGLSASGKNQREIRTKLLADFHAYPVFLPQKGMDKFYLGFCNRTVWPLFHYFPTLVVYEEDYWAQYETVNRLFRDAILEILRPDDVVWIHDYHLMLLPQMLREKMPTIPIGFFLHIPFPSFEIYRLLPTMWRRGILRGLLGADLLGFHTHDYTQYFLRCVLRILGLEHNLGRILVGERIVKADAFPMGIDFQKYRCAAEDPAIRQEAETIKSTIGDSKLILSIDRLDYTKGILHRLRGYEVFLEQNPEWRGKVVLSMIVVPSRVGAEHYQRTKGQIDELVGKINGRFGGVHWTPILYQYKYQPLQPLVAQYSASDVALVTPLRDGMNLVAKEYVAARADQRGVLILSEMAGAAKELSEAIIVNPNDIEEIAAALKEALEMPPTEQMRRNQAMQNRLRQYDVTRWAGDFVQSLLSLRRLQDQLCTKYLSPSKMTELLCDFGHAQRRVLFLDYDGTLTHFVEHPPMARPSEQLLALLQHVARDPQNEVVLISGRDKETMQDWFGALNVGLVAEHGVWVKEQDRTWEMTKSLSGGWKSQILPILEMYADRLPGSFVEQKEFSLVWHYRGADPDLSSARARELIDDLVHFTANMGIQVIQGSKIVEIRNAEVNKGLGALHWLSKVEADFILAAGDDWTDEDLFKAIPLTAYSIKVGMTQSQARYYLREPREVLLLLERLRDANGGITLNGLTTHAAQQPGERA